MARSLGFFVLLLLLCSICSPSCQARPFVNILRSTTDGGIQSILDGLSLGAIKDSGPSPGEGHHFTNSNTLGGIKDSGPSPGQGHHFTNSNTFGGIKDSGPSPGQGHHFTNSNTLGGIKNSGPSPGEGHKFATGTHQ